MNSNSRWTGMAAVIFSTLALGLSCWAVACGSTSAPSSSPALPASTSLSATTTPAGTSATNTPTATPIAQASSSSNATATVGASPSSVKTDSNQQASGKEVIANAQLRIKRLVVSKGVKGREPVEPVTQVSAGPEPLYAFVEVENRSADAGAIVISFEKGGSRTGNIELKVPGNQNRWRTWGFSRGVRESGSWVVVVRSLGGRELARTAFEAS